MWLTCRHTDKTRLDKSRIALQTIPCIKVEIGGETLIVATIITHHRVCAELLTLISYLCEAWCTHYTVSIVKMMSLIIAKQVAKPISQILSYAHTNTFEARPNVCIGTFNTIPAVKVIGG
jgi:hypothetical protein